MTAAICASDLTKRWPGVLAVAGLSFEVMAGEIFGLVGPDGAGKTTVLRMLAGVLTPDAGSATVAGFDMTREAEAAKARISYMPQRFGLYEDLTVDENIRFYADVFGVPHVEREPRARRLLDAADLNPFRGRLAGQLSGGMKQKLGLVCALVHRPGVVLLDEPTNGVDPVSRREFWQILYSLLGEGIAMVLATAYLDEAERCHRVALLHQGRLLFCDTPAALKQNFTGAVVAVASPDPWSLRAALAGAEGVLNVVMVGDGVHVLVDDADLRIPELRARMRATDLLFRDLSRVAPTIEDLFVAATFEGQTERDR